MLPPMSTVPSSPDATCAVHRSIVHKRFRGYWDRSHDPVRFWTTWAGRAAPCRWDRHYSDFGTPFKPIFSPGLRRNSGRWARGIGVSTGLLEQCGYRHRALRRPLPLHTRGQPALRRPRPGGPRRDHDRAHRLIPPPPPPTDTHARAAGRRGETAPPVQAENAARPLRATTVMSVRQARGSPKPPAARAISLIPSPQRDQKMVLGDKPFEFNRLCTWLRCHTMLPPMSAISGPPDAACGFHRSMVHKRLNLFCQRWDTSDAGHADVRS